MSSHCAHDARPRVKRAMIPPIPAERSPLEQYGGFIEPRQLSLGTKDARTHTALARDSFLPRSPHHDGREREHDHMSRPYGNIEHSRYSPPSRFVGAPPPEFTAHGSRGDPFLWSGDYGPGTIPGGPDDYHPLPFDDWGSRGDGRHSMGYEPPPFFGHPLPSIGEIMGHAPPLMHIPDGRGPPIPTYAPISPFPYEGAPPHDMFNHGHPGMHSEYENPAQMPLLPFINNQPEFGDERGPPQDEPDNIPTPKKARTSVTQRNSKPLQVEDLLHDHSRFAKVVKAFLSIEVPEARTVPEISKRVSEMYAGQYPDFEAVKRMVNDVLQKHKAFWHPGRGSPYQLNLGEGRARREFPSSSRRGRGGRHDDDSFYGGRTTRSKKTRRAAIQEENYQSLTPSRQNSVEADPDYVPSGGAYHPHHEPEAFTPEPAFAPLPPNQEPAPSLAFPVPVYEDHHRQPHLSGNLAMIMNPPPMHPHVHEARHLPPIDPVLLAAVTQSQTEPPIDPQLASAYAAEEQEGRQIKLESADREGSIPPVPPLPEDEEPEPAAETKSSRGPSPTAALPPAAIKSAELEPPSAIEPIATTAVEPTATRADSALDAPAVATEPPAPVTTTSDATAEPMDLGSDDEKEPVQKDTAKLDS